MANTSVIRPRKPFRLSLLWRTQAHYGSTGLTLLELLVVVTIIGVLLALLIPAVQAARETARRQRCSTNLRQIGIAIANYESAFQMLPPGSSHGKSLFVNLLPYIEQVQLASKVVYADRNGAQFLNSVLIPTYVCPSDAAPDLRATGSAPTAGTNYAACSGVWANDTGFNGLFRTLMEFRPYDSGPITVASVSDGLSQTIAVGEILRADGTGNRLRVPWELPLYFEPGEIEQLASTCRNLPHDPVTSGWQGSFMDRGTPWHAASYVNTFYNHVLTPNEPSCLNGSSD